MKPIIDFLNNRALVIALLATGNFISADADISIAGFLQDLTTRTEEIATAPVLQSNDIYVLEEYLNVMLIQNPEIREIAKIQPDGTVLKTAAGKGYAASTRSVASEPWYTTLCLTSKPYCAIIRDRQGTPLLFRAWPIPGPGAGEKIQGITSVKIDINKFIQSVSANKTDPLEILFNDTPVFRRNWVGVRTIFEDSFTFSASDKFVIRYTEPRSEPPAPGRVSPEPSAIVPKNTSAEQTMVSAAAPNIEAAPAIVQRETEPENPAAPAGVGNNKQLLADIVFPETLPDKTVLENPSETPIPSGEAKKVAETSNAATIQSWLSTDSILTTGYDGSSNRPMVLFILLFAGLGFVVVFIFTTIMVRRARRERREQKERDAIFRADPVPAIIAEKETQIMEKEETRLTEKEETRLIEKIPAVRPGYSGEPLDESSLAERETRELPALREFIDEFLKKIHEVSHESNINQRNRVFEEINDDLNVWARSEIRQLSGKLGLLLQAIKQCESKDGNSAELQVLRYEVMRIIKEVEDVEDRLPQRNSVLIVS